MDPVTLEVLSDTNIDVIREIRRDDISEAFVDSADTLIALTQYGLDHHCKGQHLRHPACR